MNRPNLYELIESVARERADEVFCIERKKFRRIEWTYADILGFAASTAMYLQQLGLQKGDKVGICAPNGPGWLAVFIACVRLGIPVVPIDVNSSEAFIGSVARKTDMKVLFKTIYRPVAVAEVQMVEMEQLVGLLPVNGSAETAVLSGDDILEIVFTSGSTGDPKGVVLSHANVVANVEALSQVWSIGSGHRLLSMIPLSHMFEQTVGFLIPFLAGSRVTYVQSVRPFQVIQALIAEQITTIVTVPAFLSLLRRRIVEQAETHHFMGQLRLELRIARLLPRAARRYIFQGIFMQLGPGLKLVAVGGAALAPDLEDFWEGLGVRIVQGYGLTETSPIATYSSPGAKRPRSVGRCLPGQKVALGADDEILLAGDNVFQGYFDSPEETAKVLQNGWYHTGDIGRLDKDGYLFITGRKKNMLLSESGLNIYPEDIETALANYAEIRDSIVMLYPIEGKEVLTAVVLSDTDPDRIAAIVREVNGTLASHQTVQHTIVWPDSDFPRTPTRKIRRQQVIDQVLDGTDSSASAGEHAPGAPVTQLAALVSSVGGVPAARVIASANLVSDLGFDSLKRLELVSKIEEELGAYIDESAINGSTTIADLEALVTKAAHSPKARLFNFPVFESYPLTVCRVILQWPLLVFASLFQSLIAEPLPDTHEPVVYVANHTSHFDALTVLRMLSNRRRRTIVIGAAKDYFFKNKLMSYLIRLFFPLVPVDREGNIQTTLRQIGGYIDGGFSVVLFPEGTRGRGEKLLPFKPGIGVIAQELEIPVVPMRITGNDRIMPKGSHIPRRGKTHVRVGKPLQFGKDGDYRQTTAEIEKAVTQL